MRKIFYLLFISFLLLCLSSCLTTLYPIFQEKDIIFNESLLGYWKCSEKSKETGFVEFLKIPDDRKPELPPGIRSVSGKGYLVSRMNNSGIIMSQYFVFLAKIGSNQYLDYYPAEMPSQKNVNKLYSNYYMKMHTNYRFDLKDNNHFEMKRFDQSFLDKLISDNQINIRHEVIGGKNVITASTNDLQKFIMKYSDDPRAFGGDITSCSRIIDY